MWEGRCNERNITEDAVTTQLMLHRKYTSLQESFVHLVNDVFERTIRCDDCFLINSQTCHFDLPRDFPLLLWEAKVAPHSVVSSAALLLVRSVDLKLLVRRACCWRGHCFGMQNRCEPGRYRSPDD